MTVLYKKLELILNKQRNRERTWQFYILFSQTEHALWIPNTANIK